VSDLVRTIPQSALASFTTEVIKGVGSVRTLLRAPAEKRWDTNNDSDRKANHKANGCCIHLSLDCGEVPCMAWGSGTWMPRISAPANTRNANPVQP